jgi:hypothetical protein
MEDEAMRGTSGRRPKDVTPLSNPPFTTLHHRKTIQKARALCIRAVCRAIFAVLPDLTGRKALWLKDLKISQNVERLAILLRITAKGGAFLTIRNIDANYPATRPQASPQPGVSGSTEWEFTPLFPEVSESLTPIRRAEDLSICDGPVAPPRHDAPGLMRVAAGSCTPPRCAWLEAGGSRLLG